MSLCDHNEILYTVCATVTFLVGATSSAMRATALLGSAVCAVLVLELLRRRWQKHSKQVAAPTRVVDAAADESLTPISPVPVAAAPASTHAPADESVMHAADAAADESVTNAPALPLHQEFIAALQLASECPLLPTITTDAGRGYAARRAVDVGEEVLRVRVTVWAPSWPCESTSLGGEEASVCKCDLGAGASLLASYGSDGGDSEAENAAWLAGELQSIWLLAIRCALLSRSEPSSWAALKQLEHHATTRMPAAQRMVLGAAVRLSRALELGADLKLSPEELGALLGALLTNAFGIRAAGEERARRLDVRPSALAVSLAASLFNHSCEPNVITDHRLVDDGMLVFRAARRISAGEACFIAYTASEEPTYVRRRELFRSKSFWCVCAKCADPLEGDTFGGCLRCPRCTTGWQLYAPCSGEWACGRCGWRTPLADVVQWDEEMRAELSTCLEPSAQEDEEIDGDLDWLPSSSRGCVWRVRAFIAEALKRCHPNHAMLLQARLALLAFGFGDEHGGVGGEAWLRARLAAASEALALAERILPRADQQKGDLHFQMGLAHHRLAQVHLKVTSQAGKRAALNELRSAAAAMLRSSREFRHSCSEGEAAGPCVAATEFASLVVEQVRRLQVRPIGTEG